MSGSAPHLTEEDRKKGSISFDSHALDPAASSSTIIISFTKSALTWTRVRGGGSSERGNLWILYCCSLPPFRSSLGMWNGLLEFEMDDERDTSNVMEVLSSFSCLLACCSRCLKGIWGNENVRNEEEEE